MTLIIAVSVSIYKRKFCVLFWRVAFPVERLLQFLCSSVCTHETEGEWENQL